MNWKRMIGGGMLLGVVLAGATGLEAGETKAKPEAVTRARLVTLTATVEAVDAAKRTVTLVRTTTSGERSGQAKVAAKATITLSQKAVSQ